MILSDSKISLEVATKLILASPKSAFFLQGAPGVGKTFATRAALEAAGYSVIIVDVQNISPDDSASIPIVKDGTLTFAGHEKWVPRPKMAIILDEFPKAAPNVCNTFLPLIFGRPRRFLEHEYPEDTIVVLTGNSAEFRTGDVMKPHIRNRIVELNIADPTPQSMLKVALDLGWDSRVINWAQNTPAALVSYDAEMVTKPDTENVDRYFGYDPRFPQRPFVSLRALESVSILLNDFTEAGIDPFEARAAFAGTMGERATQSFLADLRKTGEFVPFSTILANPMTAKIPSSLYDQRMVALQCAAKTDTKNWETVLNYTNRLHAEVQQVFSLNVMIKTELVSKLARYPRWNQMIQKATT